MAEGAQPLPPDSTPQTGKGNSPSPEPVLDQGGIEALLAASAGASSAAASTSPASGDSSAGAASTGKGQPVSGLSKGDIDYLLSQAENALASLDSPSDAAGGVPAQPFKLTDFAASSPSAEAATLDLIRDVELDLKIELGRSQMYLEDVLKLRKGSVVPLDKLAGDPVDVYVNGRLIARGEVLVLNDNFCVRVAELIASEQVA
jgi:flagellar motor switch protein FliN/FliY